MPRLQSAVGMGNNLPSIDSTVVSSCSHLLRCCFEDFLLQQA